MHNETRSIVRLMEVAGLIAVYGCRIIRAHIQASAKIALPQGWAVDGIYGRPSCVQFSINDDSEGDLKAIVDGIQMQIAFA